MKNIFVDIDETLLHTFSDYETPTKDAVEVNIGEVVYKTVLRKGAIKFLSELRTYGEVYALTAATADYAAVMNLHFYLRFEYIFSRESIQKAQADPDFFIKGPVYLYDNLPRRENMTKLFWLRPLGPIKYIQVPAFYNNKTEPLTDELIKELVDNLND